MLNQQNVSITPLPPFFCPCTLSLSHSPSLSLLWSLSPLSLLSYTILILKQSMFMPHESSVQKVLRDHTQLFLFPVHLDKICLVAHESSAFLLVVPWSLSPSLFVLALLCSLALSPLSPCNNNHYSTWIVSTRSATILHTHRWILILCLLERKLSCSGLFESSAKLTVNLLCGLGERGLGWVLCERFQLVEMRMDRVKKVKVARAAKERGGRGRN